MAVYKYEDLREQYNNFAHPQLQVFINEKDFSKNKKNLKISDVTVENTAGYEASVASFWIYNSYLQSESQFDFPAVKGYITIGLPVTIRMGYDTSIMEVFSGFISQVNFSYESGDIPGVKVTCMDVKGIMMATRYEKQLTATTYSESVHEIFESDLYQQMESNGLIKKVEITDTPDKKTKDASLGGSNEGASAKSMEMVAESDYEYVVKVAKRFNYEFFTSNGVVLFRPAKNNKEVLINIGPSTGLKAFDVEYDITGLVERVEVRTTDVGKGKVIAVSDKVNNKISYGNKAKALLKGTRKVYVDPTAADQEDCKNRLSYLLEDISYRFGTLTAELMGLPHFIPGRFIILDGLGKGADNTFYLTKVTHIMDSDNGYYTRIEGKAAKLQ